VFNTGNRQRTKLLKNKKREAEIACLRPWTMSYLPQNLTCNQIASIAVLSSGLAVVHVIAVLMFSNFCFILQVWDVLSNEQVVKIVSSAPSRASAACVLVESAANEWKLKYPTSKMDDCAVVCLFLDGKMDTESDYDEPGFCSAPTQSHHSGVVMESDDGQNSERSFQRSMTVRSSEENDSFKRSPVDVIQPVANILSEDQNWSGLEGITRVNSLVQLPRFSDERPKS